MIFHEAAIPGIFVIEPELVRDDRGFLARFCADREFEERGLTWKFLECSISFNDRAGTVRGMHYQAAPHEETKLVRCTMGAIFDVVLDLRNGSRTWGKWIATELSATNHKLVYVPSGCTHGYQTLSDNTEVEYQISERYAPEFARGVRWDDPAFGIEWPPAAERIISLRDRTYPLLEQLSRVFTSTA